MVEDITPLVITYNEAANITRTLDRLAWARRIVVVDSGSTTIETLRNYPLISASRSDPSAVRQFRQPMQFWNFTGGHRVGAVARCRL